MQCAFHYSETKVIVHWKLKLLNFLVDSVLMARISATNTLSTTETILKQTMNKAKCESVNVEWTISAFNMAWYSVQVLLHKSSNIKNGKDIIKNGGTRCVLFLPKAFNKTGNYLKLNTTFWVVSVKKKLWRQQDVVCPRMFHMEICVPFLQTHLWFLFQAFVVIFQ